MSTHSTNELETLATEDQGERVSLTQERDRPALWQQLFASVFTPTWTSGILLFCCLLLPAYKGCSNNTIYLGEVIIAEGITTDNAFLKFYIAWPFILGLVISIGTLVLVWTNDPEKSRILWWSYASLIVVNTCFVLFAIVLALLSLEPSGSESEVTESDWNAIFFIGGALTISAILLALIPLTLRYCKSWYTATMWLQLALTITAAICLTFIVPGILLANEILIGGKVAIACAVLLIVTTLIQQFDGHRALTRGRHDSRVQLSLGTMLLLMHVCGLACAWVGTVFLFPN
ncbi:MAG: hypothetical protein COA78_03545 [Blastopirellula sp.]|nr:MAG: hypothetical protein COA78_03545 [Blastopirellula sp.]